MDATRPRPLAIANFVRHLPTDRLLDFLKNGAVYNALWVKKYPIL